MLSGIYSREASNPGLARPQPDALPAAPTSWLSNGLGRRAELVLSLATVLLASGAVWSVSSWLLASWELH